MIDLKYCPMCEVKSEIELIDYTERIIVDGKEIIYKAKSYECPECDEMFDTKQTLGENLESAKRAIEREGKCTK